MGTGTYIILVVLIFLASWAGTAGGKIWSGAKAQDRHEAQAREIAQLRIEAERYRADRNAAAESKALWKAQAKEWQALAMSLREDVRLLALPAKEEDVGEPLSVEEADARAVESERAMQAVADVRSPPMAEEPEYIEDDRDEEDE